MIRGVCIIATSEIQKLITLNTFFEMWGVMDSVEYQLLESIESSVSGPAELCACSTAYGHLVLQQVSSSLTYSASADQQGPWWAGFRVWECRTGSAAKAAVNFYPLHRCVLATSIEGYLDEVIAKASWAPVEIVKLLCNLSYV